MDIYKELSNRQKVFRHIACFKKDNLDNLNFDYLIVNEKNERTTLVWQKTG